ncbi:D-glycerate 2-kinase [Clostridiaceae bacterium JG1575]|nr:D-glycerate 2-kinase [Clostridiaceae bacterium JG1575]
MGQKNDAQRIINACLAAADPKEAVKSALSSMDLQGGRLLLLAIGKAAWTMAYAASEALGDRLDEGIVITKYDHAQGPLPRIRIREAAHPVPDEASFRATNEAMDLFAKLKPEDHVLFLVSGGGSALFEAPCIPPEELFAITEALLKSGADIVEINTLRKRFSRVKGGRFAAHCAPAVVHAVILSDIIGDPLDMIASGPAAADSSTSEQALEIVQRYGLTLSKNAQEALLQETPKAVDNVDNSIIGSVRILCEAAAAEALKLGYAPIFLTDRLNAEAREVGRVLASIGQSHQGYGKKAFIAGGECIVHVKGQGLGGRNQELALAAAEGIAGSEDLLVFSLGSDGTDGPTDAAGGIVTGSTKEQLASLGLSIPKVLADNDAYHALDQVEALIRTGPTGTNVNDVCVLLVGR